MLAIPLQILACVALLGMISALVFRKLLPFHWPLAIFAAVEFVETLGFALTSVPDQWLLFRVAEILKLVLSAFLIWTLSRSVFSRYPAIGSFASRIAALTIATCLLLGWIAFLTDPQPPAGRSPDLHFFISVDRAVTTGLLGFLFVLSVFVGWFPVRMGKNLSRILIGFLLILTSSWMGHLASNAAPQYTGWANVAYSLVLLAAGVYWLLTVVPAGEAESAATIPQWDPERLERMTSQLAQMEAQLSRRGY